ncbi:MAG: hypothetical protein ABI197_05240 [Granulicella sp.]
MSLSLKAVRSLSLIGTLATSREEIEKIYAPVSKARTSVQETRIITGRKEILAYRDLLVRLANCYGQYGAMDHLEMFLGSENLLKKKQHLVLIGPNPMQPETGVVAAVLLSEYRVFGVGLRVFIPDDASGRRTLIARSDTRIEMARLAADALMSRGALLAMQSWRSSSTAPGVAACDSFSEGRRRGVYTERIRIFSGYLELQSTLDATLERIGQKTRFNLRYYRRRAEAQLGCHFVKNIQINRAEFLAFNRRCMYAVGDDLAGWRYDEFVGVSGMFVHGIKERNGDWLSILGGRRYGDTVEIDWQMNRGDLQALSLSTVMRSYFIEHEIGQGTKKMYIEGGTPQALRHYFEREVAQDLIVFRYGRLLGPMRCIVRKLVKKQVFVLQVLTEEGHQWMPWFRGS